MTRSAANRAARRAAREDRALRARLSRWVIVAERLASERWYPQRDSFAREDALGCAALLRRALQLLPLRRSGGSLGENGPWNIVGEPAFFEVEEIEATIDEANGSLRNLRQILIDARIAPETRGDEVAFRAQELDVFDRTREDDTWQDRAQDMFERACLIVRTSWVAIAINGGREWVWDGDSIETWMRVRELRGAPVRGVEELARSRVRSLSEPQFKASTWLRAFAAKSEVL